MHRVVTPPAVEPVELEMAKAQLRVDHDIEDALIEAYISAARMYGEGAALRSFITQTIEAAFPCFPPGPILLPRPPLQAVESVTYTDGAGVEQVLPADAYVTDTISEPGRITPAHGTSWPAGTDVRIQYTAGYGDTPENVPPTYTQGILMLVGHWYATRETVVVGTITSKVPLAADALFGQDRIYRVPT